MKQYNAIKGKHPDALLLFRVGDFYETFGEDAIKASEILGIVLTKRKNGAAATIELAGFPHHSLDTYLPKLVRAGQRVAICDQLEDPKMTKTIVKRGVTELVTPGVSYNDKILDHRSNNFLASIFFARKELGISFLDVSTGEFLVAQGSEEYIDKLLQSLQPKEVLFPRNKKNQFSQAFGEGFYTYCLDEWAFQSDFGRETLLKHFGTKSLKGFGIDDLEAGIIAAGAALHYLAETAHDKVGHLTAISRIEEEKYVWLDKFTIRNLELFHSPHPDAVTLIEVLDHTISPMGSRMLKRWLALPLKAPSAISDRLALVKHAYDHPEFSEILGQHINQIGDLERLISKVAVGRVSPREVVQLLRGLNALEPIQQSCKAAGLSQLDKIADRINLCTTIRERIERELQPEAPVQVAKGNVIRDGVNQELDELRSLLTSGKDHLVSIQQRESERTGIPSLKIGFNNVFGYYLEVTNAHKEKAPAEWTRKQTLVNAERYITEELKDYESKILGAEEKIQTLEGQLFNALVLDLADYITPIQLNAQLVAQLDCLLSFAAVAHKHNYVQPEINDSKVLDIRGGRHPVIETRLPVGEAYIPNDVMLNDDAVQLMMITGPNMSGKSALLRQTALIVIMAQIGSFVPAEQASIGLVDKIFTRVGASDNLSLGESTFMVEMNETASILNNLSDRSLILLDEIGRGTSTYDGISIAWAIAEFLHEHPARPKTLFATHYHELNDMTKAFERIKNFNVSIREVNNKVLFLRKLVPGGSEHSFGIHVAKMAGMPRQVLDRSSQILKELETSHSSTNHSKPRVEKAKPSGDYQLSFFQLDDPVLEQIREEIVSTDINNLTPVEALLKLNQIKTLIGK